MVERHLEVGRDRLSLFLGGEHPPGPVPLQVDQQQVEGLPAAALQHGLDVRAQLDEPSKLGGGGALHGRSLRYEAGRTKQLVRGAEWATSSSDVLIQALIGRRSSWSSWRSSQDARTRNRLPAGGRRTLRRQRPPRRR